MTSSDNDLLPRLQLSVPTAQQELFQRCERRLRRYFYRHLPNVSDVEDNVSEVITRALEGIRTGQQSRVLDAVGLRHRPRRSQ